jgi:hypothetical protein
MRFVLYLIVLSLVLPGALAAQYVGFSIGRTVSTVDWQYPPPPADCGNCITDASPSASRHGTTAALLLQWRPSEWWGGTTEVRLAPKGYAVTQPTLSVEYLQVPLLLRVGRLTHPDRGVRPFVEVGPALAVRARCRVFYNNTSDPCTRGAVFGQDWQLRRLEVSAQAGAGLAWQVRETLVLVGARVDWGLRDIGGPEQVPTKHRAGLWYVGALLPLGPVPR